MTSRGVAPDRVETTVPGRPAIELVSFYEELRDYYPYCELQTKRWFVDHVRPDWWIFDVGANIGYYSILFGQLAPQGRVFAFEPTVTAEKLRRNLEHNAIGNVAVHEVALGAATGDKTDRIYRLWGGEGEVQTYPFYRLDDFVARHAIERVDCLKIDVDSFDFEVLMGAEETLRRHNPVIVVELNHALAKRNQSAGEALAWLARQGYESAVVLDHDNFVLQREAPALADLPGAARLQLVFPPALRVEERLQDGAGAARGEPIVRAARLENGATIDLRPVSAEPFSLGRAARSAWNRLVGRADEPSQPELTLDRILGATVESAAERWSYALVLDLETPSVAGLLDVELGVEVLDGTLGIVVGGDDPSRFPVPERTLAAMAGPQSVVLRVSADEARSLVLRNVALGHRPTRFKLLDLTVRRGPPAA